MRSVLLLVGRRLTPRSYARSARTPSRSSARAPFAGHHPENPASRRILEQLGFRRVADELYAPTGLLHLSYRLTSAEWRAARA